MAVDWSIFWNNIFPGFVLIVSSSIFAYIVIHRYQVRKHKKEIKDDLLQLENNTFKKLVEWCHLFSRLAFYFTEEYSKIKLKQFEKKLKKIEKEMISVEADLNKQDKIQKDKDKEALKEIDKIRKKIGRIDLNVGKMRVAHTIMSEDVIRLEKIIEMFSRKTIEFQSAVRLLKQRIRLQLKLKKEHINEINNLSERITDIFVRTDLAIEEENKEEIKKIKEENINELFDSFDSISEMILVRKVRTRQSYRIKSLSNFKMKKIANDAEIQKNSDLF